jgi:hypothetical protein
MENQRWLKLAGQSTSDLGRLILSALEIKGTLSDAQWHSYSVNKAHGLRRDNVDIERAAKAALRHPQGSNLSDSQIA